MGGANSSGAVWGWNGGCEAWIDPGFAVLDDVWWDGETGEVGA